MQLNFFSNNKFMLLFLLCLAFSSQTLLKSKREQIDKIPLMDHLKKLNLDQLIELTKKNTFSNGANEVLYQIFNKIDLFIGEIENKITNIIENDISDNAKTLIFLEQIHQQMTKENVDEQVLKDFKSEYENIKKENGSNISEELTKKLKSMKENQKLNL